MSRPFFRLNLPPPPPRILTSFKLLDVLAVGGTFLLLFKAPMKLLIACNSNFCLSSRGLRPTSHPCTYHLVLKGIYLHLS